MMSTAKSLLKIMTMAVLMGTVVVLTFLTGYGVGLSSSLERPGSEGIQYPAGDEREGQSPDYEGGPVDEELGVFWEAWRLIDRDFYGPLPPVRDRIYGAIRGMVSTLSDAHTVFLTPDQADIIDRDDQGSFEGIGASIQWDNEISRPRLTYVYPGQPAAEAGLSAGDVILAIDGEPTDNMSLFDVIGRIRGPRGSKVSLTILRPRSGESTDIAITRARIDIPTVESRLLVHNVAYLRLTDFNSVATDKVRESLEELLKRRPAGLVLDLRANPGGFLHTAIEVASQFIAEGIIVTERDNAGEEEIFRAQPGGLATDPSLPLVVLVDAGTASAAEIVAAAIQELGRGVVIGEKTFGKASVQVSHKLTDRSELRLTVARWFTPAGKKIEEGLSPDIEVEATQGDTGENRDPQLDRAIEHILESDRQNEEPVPEGQEVVTFEEIGAKPQYRD